MEILRIPDLILSRLKIRFLAKSKLAVKKAEVPQENFPYPERYAQNLFIWTVGLIYSTIAPVVFSDFKTILSTQLHSSLTFCV